MSKIWDDIEDVDIEIPELRLERAFDPKIKIKDKYTKHSAYIHEKGSGVQRHLILAMLEIYRQLKIGRNCMLLFEEPEIYLHVGAQKKMYSILKNLSKKGQVIISTHSNIFLDRSDLSFTYLFHKVNGETKIKNSKDVKIILEELNISPSDLFLTNGIIFVEGPSDREILEVFAKSLFEDWDEYNIAIVPLGGSNIEHQKPELLIKINPNICLILDSDKKSENSDLSDKKKNLKSKFEREGIKVYFLMKDNKMVRSIENLFEKESIEKALNIKIEREIDNYCDVPFIIGKKLTEIEKENNPNFDQGNLNDTYIRKKYDKINHGKKIAKKTVELHKIHPEVKDLFDKILVEFGLRQ